MKIKYPLSTVPIRMLDAVGIHSPAKFPVRFIIEKGNWSIKWDGHYVTREVEKIAKGTAKVETQPYALSNKITHFGSQFQYVSWYKHMAKSNRMICTFFHGKRTDDAGMARHVDEFLAGVPHLEKVITAASMIENRLLEWGVPRQKLVRIPIGIDCSMFRPFSEEQKKIARQKYGIRNDQLVIGSFQKDGNGWEEGMEPKMIKGPDILVSLAKELSKHVPIFLFLTGPARGYVKKHLDDLNIPYVHEYLDDYLQLPSRFAPLDFYINPSREEGGPKGILEAMASGVPVISTRVGMAPDVIQNKKNGILADVEDVTNMVSSILDLWQDQNQIQSMTQSARQDMMALDWSEIGKSHYNLVYKDLL
jgi:glycosyltransferase involved in cell wall biosynthesis